MKLDMKTHLDFSGSVARKWDSREDMYNAVVPHGGVGAEIGVYNGDNSEKLASIVKPSKLKLIDRWMVIGMPDNLRDDHLARKQNVIDRFAGKCDIEILDMSSEDASYKIGDQTLDWVFIDGNHSYPMALWDLELYLPLVKVGGIVMMHDFTTQISAGGVIEAVWYHLNKHGDMEVLGKTREKNKKLLKQPTIALKKTIHKKIYKTWW